MKPSFSPTFRRRHALTLIEALLVLVILAVLVAMLFPPIHDRGPVSIPRAKLEMAQIFTAIRSYHSQYGRYPVSSNVQIAATSAQLDFTFGGPTLDGILGGSGVTLLNTEVVAILMDITKYPGGGLTINFDRSLNPQQIKFLNAHMVADTNFPGVGPDLVFRDPWGHPYIISMDLNGDERCRDAFYKNHTVSRIDQIAGFYGLTNTNAATGLIDSFELDGGVMVWSLGPDGKADLSKPANVPPNKDNVLSWK